MMKSFGRGVVASCLFAGICSVALATPAPPIVAGYEQLRHAPKSSDAASSGELLLGELNCSACHQTDSPRIDRKGAPDLSVAGSRITPQYLRAFLSDPHGVKPGSTMPDLLRDLDAATKQQDVEALTHFLFSLGGPVVPVPSPSDQGTVELGRKLFQSVGCVACHAPENKVETIVPSVPLVKLATKTTVEKLTAFLLGPTKDRPAGRMPNLLLNQADAQAIALYLLRDQITNPQNADAKPGRIPGLHYKFYATLPDDARIEAFEKLKPTSEGTFSAFSLDVPNRPDVNFAFRYNGIIAIPRQGKYEFFTQSDDGSRLFIDNKEIVDNDGKRPVTEKSGAVELSAGDHLIEVTYFQASGPFELHVLWKGPKIRKEMIPADVLYTSGVPLMPLQSEHFTVDEQKVQQGRELFQTLGCAACHNLEGLKPGNSAKALALLDPAAASGCLAAQVGKDAPKYDLRADQIAAIQAALKDKSALAGAPTSAEQVDHAMAAMNCYACHNRNGVGGPAADRVDYFTMNGTAVDMGDEGRLPPRLTNIGAKLLPEAIEQIVFEGKLHVRPVLATHMPMFSRDRLPGLGVAFEQTDGPQPDVEPAYTEKSASDGRKLVGTRGLGCVNCHGVADVNSLGMPAPNLSSVHLRLRPAWFTKLLENPAKVNPNTRMPSFWDHGDVALPEIAGGTMQGQIDAIWAYLSQGDRMALPAGLLPSKGMELVPIDVPIVHRTFVEPGLFVPGKVGTRAILVGYPEQLSVGFDAGVVRLAVAWRGRFFDAVGQWEGRGGKALGPLGTDVLHMPDGPAFAVLSSPTEAWPKVLPNQRNIGGQFKGYVLDKQERPTFHYILNDVSIEEQPIPQLQKAVSLIRKFHLTANHSVEGLYFLAASGPKIESTSPDVWSVGKQYSVKINAPALKPILRSDGPIQQVLIPVTFQNNQADFDIEVNW
jgi:mono/diheme cytochrome c family protein